MRACIGIVLGFFGLMFGDPVAAGSVKNPNCYPPGSADVEPQKVRAREIAVGLSGWQLLQGSNADHVRVSQRFSPTVGAPDYDVQAYSRLASPDNKSKHPILNGVCNLSPNKEIEFRLDELDWAHRTLGAGFCDCQFSPLNYGHGSSTVNGRHPDVLPTNTALYIKHTGNRNTVPIFRPVHDAKLQTPNDGAGIANLVTSLVTYFVRTSSGYVPRQVQFSSRRISNGEVEIGIGGEISGLDMTIGEIDLIFANNSSNMEASLGRLSERVSVDVGMLVDIYKDLEVLPSRIFEMRNLVLNFGDGIQVEEIRFSVGDNRSAVVGYRHVPIALFDARTREFYTATRVWVHGVAQQ